MSGLPAFMADALSYAAAAPETLAQSNCRSLARIIADLINENEPMLRATHDGSTVTVAERCGPARMTFTIEPDHRGASSNA